ncbi:MAG: hypothetical protein A2234_06065 [Elusimicrobia bacterium RIFOXYA2_FULL_58_8]|nr:MAG: hypothetical protein A2285_04415 [Elusimicrobia bacterium RIFOXYA12_FULL_57_11]OGS17022.1 MAG: hypothetical protein A2234_06065 [Elusimicrobia bacterium RIFOXYA2_FULL_58_8]
MKLFIFFLILTLAPVSGRADTFFLKDGARLEGEVTGEMNGTVLVKTQYGSLTINRSDIVEQKAAEEQSATAQPPAALPEPAAGIAASTEPAQLPLPEPAAEAQASTSAALPAPQGEAVPLTFSTVLPETGNRLLLYSEGGVITATETFDAAGALVSLEGILKNGTYSEYYPEGGLKAVKTLVNGKMSGSLKTYYPSGTLQVEAYYLDGAKEGDFKYFGENGKPLMAAAYKNNLLNGWKREYNPDGTLKNEAFYADDRAVDPPQAKPEAAPLQEQASLVTVKAKKVARGEILTFSLNDKYIGKLSLDKEFNIISQAGKVSDGPVKIYNKDGKLQKEIIFKQNEVKILRVYEEDGALRAAYTFREGKATEFALK